MTDKLRVGIVSANWGAMAHLPAWRALADQVEVTAICTSRQQTAEAAAAQFGVARPFWSYEEMCADPAIDLIDAGTNPKLREAIVACALANGKHAVNNLPFATSYAAAAHLADLQAQRGVVGGASSSVMGLPHLVLMKDMLDAGEIGEVYQVDCAWELSFFLDVMPGFPYTWFRHAGLGVGVLSNHGSHMLHAMRHLLGPVAEVAAQITTFKPTWDIPGEGIVPVETDDTAHALLRFDSGATGTLRTSWIAADSPGFSLDIKGSKGRLRLTSLLYPNAASAEVYHARNGAMVPTGQVVPLPERLLLVEGRPLVPDMGDMTSGGQRLSIARVFESVVRAIRNGGEPLPSFARAAEVQRVVEAMYRASDEKTWITPASIAA